MNMVWKMFLARVYLAITGIALCEGNIDPNTVLEELRDADRAFTQRCAISAKVERPDKLHPVVIYRTHIARDATRIAIHEDQFDYPLPPYYVPPKHSRSPLDHDPYGNYWLYQRRETFSLVERQTVVEYEIVSLVSVTPSRTLVRPSGSLTHVLCIDEEKPRLTGYVRFRAEQTLLASGRGFSRYIERAIEAKKLENGQILLRARGVFNHAPGEWRLVIEPQHRYLVREAQFYADAEPNTITERWQMTGLQIAHGVPIAKYGSWKQSPGRGKEGEPLNWHHYEFLAFKPRFDEELYALVRQRVFRPAHGAQVADVRRNPPISFIYADSSESLAGVIEKKR